MPGDQVLTICRAGTQQNKTRWLQLISLVSIGDRGGGVFVFLKKMTQMQADSKIKV